MSTVQQHLNNSFKELPKKIEAKGKQSSSNIPYRLFMYREDLRRLSKDSLKLSKSKLYLTREMLSYSMDHIEEYNIQELVNIDSQIDYTCKLKNSLDHKMEKQKLRKIKKQMVKDWLEKSAEYFENIDSQIDYTCKLKNSLDHKMEQQKLRKIKKQMVKDWLEKSAEYFENT